MGMTSTIINIHIAYYRFSLALYQMHTN